MKAYLATAFVLLASGMSLASSPILAKVNGEPITGAEVDSIFMKVHGGHAKFLGGDVEARKFLETVIDQRLLIQEAYRLGLQDQEDIRKAVNDFEDGKMTDLLLKAEVDDKAVPTKAEIKTAWEQKTAELRDLREITVETRKEADSVYLEILDSYDFDLVARICSTSSSRIYGGSLPGVGWGGLDVPLEEVAFALSPGDTAPPVKTSSGWTIVRVDEIHPVERPPLDKASTRIESILKQRRLAANKKSFSEYLFSSYHVASTDVDHAPAALSQTLASAPKTIVATWDGGSLTVEDFVTKKELDSLGMLPPSRSVSHVDELLRQTINGALALREAKRRKLNEAPEVAEPTKEYREGLMENVLYADYILKDISVTDAEVKADFEAHKSAWTAPERRRVAHILVKTREEALAARKKLDAGASFTELAKAISIDPQTAKIGGDLGWITKKDVPPAFLAVLTLKRDEVSEPVQSKFGWHVIKLTAIDPAKPMSFDAAKDEVKMSLIERKKTARRAEWVGKLRAAATIKIDDKNLHAFAKAHAAD